MIKLLLMVLMCIALQACTSTIQSAKLQEGKSSFESGDFKEAFHRLLPLASEGNAHAEYAVGYMYYYGYGVPVDAESGIFWMQKSANQNYAPAIKALGLIANNKSKGY
jgi:TPR repeat protein